MSRKDFELIAKTIRDLDDATFAMRVQVANAFADSLAQTNARFDRTRFIEAATK